MNIILYGRKGWGSVFIEAQLVWYQIPYKFKDVGDLFEDQDARQTFRNINPLAQVPTLTFTDSTTSECKLMTESAAITLWLADCPQIDSRSRKALVPDIDSYHRAEFLRWLLFIASNIYPTYTYSDNPSRFLVNECAQKDFSNQVSRFVNSLYEILDKAAGKPWFLGDDMSAIDIYIAGMIHWRPYREWFESNAPSLVFIADSIEKHSVFSKVFKQNFLD